MSWAHLIARADSKNMPECRCLYNRSDHVLASDTGCCTEYAVHADEEKVAGHPLLPFSA